MSQKNRILASLKTGKEFTTKQFESNFGIASPSKVISRLRRDGHSIYLNKRVDTCGRETLKYRLGTPNRKMVSVATAVLGASVFA